MRKIFFSPKDGICNREADWVNPPGVVEAWGRFILPHLRSLQRGGEGMISALMLPNDGGSVNLMRGSADIG